MTMRARKLIGRIVTAGAVVAAVGATAMSLSLYSSLHPGWWRTSTLKDPNKPQSRSRPIFRRQHAAVNPAWSKEQAEGVAAAIVEMHAAKDELLTGDPNGQAEWKAPDYDDNHTICGVTSEGRFFRKNEPGTYHAEPSQGGDFGKFEKAWLQLDCDKSSPVNQREKTYDEIRHGLKTPSDACLLAEVAAASADDPHASHMEDDPNYCRNGDYERDQAKKAEANGGQEPIP